MPTLGDITATHRFNIWNVVRPEMDNATAEAERFRPYTSDCAQGLHKLCQHSECEAHGLQIHSTHSCMPSTTCNRSAAREEKSIRKENH